MNDGAGRVASVVLATSALHVLSFGESRFHLPLVPLLAACVPLSTWRYRPVLRLPLTAAGVALALLVLAWSSQLPEHRERIELLLRPNGSQSPIEY